MNDFTFMLLLFKSFMLLLEAETVWCWWKYLKDWQLSIDCYIIIVFNQRDWGSVKETCNIFPRQSQSSNFCCTALAPASSRHGAVLAAELTLTQPSLTNIHRGIGYPDYEAMTFYDLYNKETVTFICHKFKSIYENMSVSVQCFENIV